MGGRVVLAFDSFKGSLNATEACDAVRAGLESVCPDLEIISCPMADGGEGTARLLMDALGGRWIPVQVTGPLFSMSVDAGFVWIESSRLAVVEMASACGLPLLDEDQRNPLETSTFGAGELIRAALNQGAEKIFLTVGGSASVDGGIGAASALGWHFFDALGKDVPACGKGLGLVAGMRCPPTFFMPEMEVLCDVTNPLCGPFGAALVYGPQKGASPGMAQKLDSDLRRFAEHIERVTGKKVAALPGGGAAGGLAAGAVAFFNAWLRRGIDVVMDAVGFDLAASGSDWVLTGEGRFDSQSLQGKVVDGVVSRARRVGARIGVLAGSIGLDETQWRAAGVSFATSIGKDGVGTEESIRRGGELLVESAADFAREFLL